MAIVVNVAIVTLATRWWDSRLTSHRSHRQPASTAEVHPKGVSQTATYLTYIAFVLCLVAWLHYFQENNIKGRTMNSNNDTATLCQFLSIHLTNDTYPFVKRAYEMAAWNQKQG